MLQCHPGAGGWINCYLTLLDRVLEINAIFLLEKSMSLTWGVFSVWGGYSGKREVREREAGGLWWNTARSEGKWGTEPGRFGGTRGALDLSPRSDWCSAELTQPILGECRCNINTHLEQMWLKAWNIEQTAATDPVPLLQHLCSINVQGFCGQQGCCCSSIQQMGQAMATPRKAVPWRQAIPRLQSEIWRRKGRWGEGGSTSPRELLSAYYQWHLLHSWSKLSLVCF